MLAVGMFLVNRYEILGKIGSGGMADVYKAKDHVLNRLVANKVLKRDYSTDATFVKKFRVEAQSAAGLSHPNIVSVYDVGEENGTHFIVMELVQGITLKNYIDMKGKLDIKEALNISVQIASGLSAAHDNRIIHRDIKPQNIIMSRDGKVKVTDFGIAKVADSTTVTTTAAGTVHYISPEQARGGYSDEKSDIYSLGITMYEMVTGRVPFEGETNVAVALLHIQGEMMPPRELEPSIPKSFEKIIMKCTQKKPDRRYASARELITDLRKVLTHPDGEYVVIPGVVPAGRTIVMRDDEVSSLKAASLQKNKKGLDDEDLSARRSGKRTSVPEEVYDTDEDDEEVNPALGKVMMVLGIGGFIILAVIIFFIIANAAGLFGGTGSLFGPKESIESSSSTESSSESEEAEAEIVKVPDLKGMTEASAVRELERAKLDYRFVEGSSDEYKEGQIYDQDPSAGTEVHEGDQVIVYISTGKEKFELDDVTGMNYEYAQAQLANDNLKVDLNFEDSDSVEKNQVIRTEPSAGTKVSEGDTIKIYVSQGAKIEMVEVPSVIGYDMDTAVSMIENAGLTVNNTTKQYSDNYAAGQVIDQSIRGGKSVEKGSSIDLWISIGSQVSSYEATIFIESPFGWDIRDENGEVNVYEEGTLTIVVEQDGVSTTVYNEYVDESSIPASVSMESKASSSGTAVFYINGIKYGEKTVTFQ